MIPLLLGITFITFWIIDLAPGDYFAQLKMNPLVSAEMVETMKREFGIGQPFLVRYFKWLWRAVHLDLGVSLAYRVDVIDLIGMRALNTVVLATASIVFAWTLALPESVPDSYRNNVDF